MAKNIKKERQKSAKLLTLDTETRGLTGNVFRVGLFDGETYYAANTFDEILNVFEQYKDYECHVYAHNLDFDLGKIATTLFTRDRVCFGKSIFINGKVVTLHTDSMILHDSLSLLPGSLEKLCQDFGLTDNAKKDLSDIIKEQGYAVYNEDGSFNKKESKGNYFENVPADDPLLNEYLEFDCRSLYEILSIVMEIAEIPLETLVSCPTTASLAMRVFKEQYSESYDLVATRWYTGEWGRFLEDHVRLSYYGGRTEVFTPELKKGFHYDANSLYPYVMKVAKFPVGYPVLLKDGQAEKKWRHWKRRAIGGGVMWCRVDVPEDMYLPVLPKRDPSGKLLFPVGKLEGVWTLPELLEAERNGCTIEAIYQMVYWERMEYIFKEFVEHFEVVKKTSKGAKRVFAKLVQNSLYGKFGMNRHRTSYGDMSERLELERKEVPYRVHKHTKNGLDMEFLEYLSESKAMYIQPHIASYTTAYARILLYRGLKEQLVKGDIAYCDTDSIACKAEMDEEMIDEDEYGKWALEGRIEEGLFLQPKMYAEKYEDGTEVIRAKGIPREKMDELSFEDFRNWHTTMKEGKQERIQIFEGLQGRKKFSTTLKSDEDFDTQREMKKSINLLLEQKRIMDYDKNVTRPHARYDYGEKKNQMDYKDYQEYEKKLNDMYDDVDDIKELINDLGYIKCMKQGDRYYEEYKQFPRSVRSKYFRKTGISIDVWAEEAGWELNDLLEEFRLMGV
ncbi:DNA polymerase [Bacillus cereus]|uniref:DNA-directed DNA polymerase n=1 Tax=Bacillus cereus VD184 TaxID=1053242 RepID=A0A9W5R0S2_BACCE|nr:DNA polymerase [Bacillus cereus]EOQ01040.1 type B DNA polymerase [Bacillus cereus VD184]